MNWIELHRVSENEAASAHAALQVGEVDKARLMFKSAAEAETAAIESLGDGKPRTLGITAVSAVSLWYKAGLVSEAEKLAHQMLTRSGLPDFATVQLQTLLQAIWNERAQLEAAVAFVPGQVTVSVRGGEIVRGGAPLDLILGKVQIIQSMFYRTAEFLRGDPFRSKGAPSKQVQEGYKPWLFQSVPGSYQFTVAIQKAPQMEMFEDDALKAEFLTDKFIEILDAAVKDPEIELPELIPDQKYRETFLKLTRNLAPTGKSFSEMRVNGAASGVAVSLTPLSRKRISEAIRPKATELSSPDNTELVINGVLRAVHLEQDWLEVIENGSTVKITGVGEAVDDLIGPMVNHLVTVKAKRGKGSSFVFIDIEQQE